MERVNETTFEAPIRWHPGFFRDAKNVGYNFTIRYEDGRNETSPVRNWPYTPDALPAGAGRYYFYALEGDDPASTPALAGPWVLGIGWLLAWAWRRGSVA